MLPPSLTDVDSLVIPSQINGSKAKTNFMQLFPAHPSHWCDSYHSLLVSTNTLSTDANSEENKGEWNHGKLQAYDASSGHELTTRLDALMESKDSLFSASQRSQFSQAFYVYSPLSPSQGSAGGFMNTSRYKICTLQQTLDWSHCLFPSDDGLAVSSSQTDMKGSGVLGKRESSAASTGSEKPALDSVMISPAMTALSMQVEAVPTIQACSEVT